MIALSFVSLVTRAQTPPPRAAYACQALISAADPEASIAPRSLVAAARFAENFVRLNGEMNTLKRLRAAGIAKRVVNDLENVDHARFALRQELVGDQAILAYFDRARAAATELEAAHVASAARNPFVTRPIFKSVGVIAGLASVGMLGLSKVTVDLYNANHPIFAIVGALAVFQVNHKMVVPLYRTLAAGVQNARILRRYAHDRRVGGRSTADIRDLDFAQFEAAVRAELADSSGKPPEVILARSRVRLPLSQSLVLGDPPPRRAPTAAEIEAAVKASGDFRLPADARALDVAHYFYYDQRLKQPVLLTLIVDRD